METLEDLIALGNEGAPQDWLDHLNGQGIGDGHEGIGSEEIERIIDSGELSSTSDQMIQATYEMQFKQCNSTNYTKGRGGNGVQYIAIHYTGGSRTSEGAAEANCIYFGREANLGASAHYFIDDGYTIWQSVSDGDTAWAVGNWAINQRSISIEVCTAGAFTENEIDRLTWLVRHLMSTYGVPADRVIRHYDANGKHCPAYYVDSARWSALRGGITTGETSSQPTNASTGGEKVYYFGHVQKGKTGTAVRMFQCVSNIRYGYNLAIDGSCGAATDKAIREIQAKLGLEQDGSCGPATWTAILAG